MSALVDSAPSLFDGFRSTGLRRVEYRSHNGCAELVASAFEDELEDTIFGKVGHYVPFGIEEARADKLLSVPR